MEDKIVGPGNKVTPNAVEPAQDTYFFERPDGSIIPTTEREAWDIMKNRQRIVGQRTVPFKLIGVSDGTKFRQAVLETHDMFKEGKPMTEIQARLRLGEQEELAAARGNIRPPRNWDTIDKNRQPVNLSQLR